MQERVMKTLLEPSKEIIEECKNGNQQAFKQIFYNYRSYAYNLIYKIAGRHADHEDLLQEIFFQIYLSLKTFRGDSAFTTWFHRIAIHVCTGSWRYQQAKKRISSEDTVDYQSVEESHSNYQDIPGQHLELKNMVEGALATLNEKLRVPLVLNIYSEMNLGEIADILDIPEGTIKSRLFTARLKVKEYIDRLEK
jgi:RNA polymerase sigma-70 factor (ECF subfamily)